MKSEEQIPGSINIITKHQEKELDPSEDQIKAVINTGISVIQDLLTLDQTPVEQKISNVLKAVGGIAMEIGGPPGIAIGGVLQIGCMIIGIFGGPNPPDPQLAKINMLLEHINRKIDLVIKSIEQLQETCDKILKLVGGINFGKKELDEIHGIYQQVSLLLNVVQREPDNGFTRLKDYLHDATNKTAWELFTIFDKKNVEDWLNLIIDNDSGSDYEAAQILQHIMSVISE